MQLDEKDLEQIQCLIKENQSQMIAYIESAILPRFNLLADGQKNILETMAPKSEIEKLREEIDFLKDVVRLHAKEIRELKKAQ